MLYLWRGVLKHLADLSKNGIFLVVKPLFSFSPKGSVETKLFSLFEGVDR